MLNPLEIAKFEVAPIVKGLNKVISYRAVTNIAEQVEKQEISVAPPDKKPYLRP